MYNNKLKKINLVVFDLDGTLLNNSGSIGEKTKKLIIKLQDLGVQFTFASGRLHSSLEIYKTEIKIKPPIISLDGAMIKNSEIIYVSYINQVFIKKAIKLSDDYLMNVALCHADNIYYTDRNLLIPEVVDKFGSHFKEISSYEDYYKKTLEVVIVGDNKQVLKSIQNKMQFPFAFGLKTSFYKSHKMGGVYFLEISKSGESKAKGLKILLKHMNIRESETVVLGDWYNDLDLFKTSAFKVALANAVPEIKKLADIITVKSNEEDGTAEFLDQLLNAKLDK